MAGRLQVAVDVRNRSSGLFSAAWAGSALYPVSLSLEYCLYGHSTYHFWMLLNCRVFSTFPGNRVGYKHSIAVFGDPALPFYDLACVRAASIGGLVPKEN